ncbi:hypothetical protein SAMN05216429_106157 [Marinobacter persicus]|uniref:Uncharacterized protein n=1 Tax=Marinobacter persicus TaxID=930118 RepID=A0A1I3UMS2_9GAMM|nr:hypothetical protein SAMN05216429_106157 [Marinobacter persicus]
MAELERYREVFTACFGKPYLIGSLHGVHGIRQRSSHQIETINQHHRVMLRFLRVWEF